MAFLTTPTARLTFPPTPAPPRRQRRSRGYWIVWRNLESELRAFADRYCNGQMPLQRQLLTKNRSDLINAVRFHGGHTLVARRAALGPPASPVQRRPHGHWADPAVMRAELLMFTARRGHPGLMPRREELLRAGRADLCYAIEKYGGFGVVAAQLHLVWHGPSSYWRVFRNVRKRLLDFVKKRGKGAVMPDVAGMQEAGRMDLVYGVALHGGVMVVAERVGLEMVYAAREEGYWMQPENVERELAAVLMTRPVEMRRVMPTSVSLVQTGRGDLATGIRDHGGWVYYAQRLGLRFAFEKREAGFWKRADDVVGELVRYVEMRYGSWEHPGKRGEAMKGGRYVPSGEMMGRDGRSDIAFAIARYHGGMERFAGRFGLIVAEDVVQTKPAEVLLAWGEFSREVKLWIEMHGGVGLMPTTRDFIRTGRYDLRYAMYKHGGAKKVGRRLQLVCTEGDVETWLPGWLGLQAGKMGRLLRIRERDGRREGRNRMVEMLEDGLDGRVVGKGRVLLIERERVGEQLDRGRTGREERGKRLSGKELEKLREKYMHMPPDDIIMI